MSAASDRDALIKKIQVVVDRKAEIDRLLEALEAVTGTSGDSPLSDTLCGLLDDSIQLIDPDQNLGLSWYIYENECGAKGHACQWPSGGMMNIHNIEDLLHFAENMEYAET